MYIPSVRFWHIVGPGFMQAKGDVTGTLQLFGKLQEEFNNRISRVELIPWNTDWKNQAELIFRLLPKDGKVYITEAAYSYGAGWGMIQLNRHLAARGIPVAAMCFADPVYRHPHLWGKWRTLLNHPRLGWLSRVLPQPEIVVPKNVNSERVVYWRQHNSWPAGHKLVSIVKDRRGITHKRTFPERPLANKYVGVTHSNIDEMEDFHLVALAQAREVHRNVA